MRLKQGTSFKSYILKYAIEAGHLVQVVSGQLRGAKKCASYSLSEPKVSRCG